MYNNYLKQSKLHFAKTKEKVDIKRSSRLALIMQIEEDVIH